jgi:hypothetical protein
VQDPEVFNEAYVDKVSAFLESSGLTVYDFPRTHIRVVADATGLPAEACVAALVTIRARIEGLDPRARRRSAKVTFKKTTRDRAKQAGVPAVSTVVLAHKGAAGQPVKRGKRAAQEKPVTDVTSDIRRFTRILHAALLNTEGINVGAWHVVPAGDRTVFAAAAMGKMLPGQGMLLFQNLANLDAFVDCRRTGCGKWHVLKELPPDAPA